MAEPQNEVIEKIKELIAASFTAVTILDNGEPYPLPTEGDVRLTREDLLDEATHCMLLALAKVDALEGGRESKRRTFDRFTEERTRRARAAQIVATHLPGEGER